MINTMLTYNIDTKTHSLSHWFTQSLCHSLCHLVTHSVTQSLNHSLTQSLTHSFTHSLSHLLAHSLTHSLTCSLTHLLTHSLTNLLALVLGCLGLMHLSMWILILPPPCWPKEFWQRKVCMSEFPACHKLSLSESPSNRSVFLMFSTIVNVRIM